LADVTFYLYYGCPWTYLAFVRLQETAMRTRAVIAWRPVLLERVMRGAGLSAKAEVSAAAQVRYRQKDLADWARFCGVAIRHGGPYPVAAEWAARGAVVALAEERAARYGEAVFRACFGECADPDDLEVVTGLAAASGIERERFRHAVEAPGTRAVLERNSDELVRRGGFGSPTMFVGDDMYVGNDRMPLVELALMRASDEPFVAPGAHGQL
jgi:2-hydroxychromene-2-carboxylate isomerase